jgi:hypothetical protein
MVGVDRFFLERRQQIVALAARLAVPAIYDRRDIARLADWRATVQIVGRGSGDRLAFMLGEFSRARSQLILPVQQATKFEL